MIKYVQITAGRGPVECARVVTLVARELHRWLQKHGLLETLCFRLVNSEPHNSERDCYMSVVFSISGDAIPESIVREWEGTVLWTAIGNRYRPAHKRKNWFVGVHFFDEKELPVINETDIVYETCRSGGKGGQNVNKVETAVRAIYRPTGMSVKCSDERSQVQNKALARQRLMLKFHEMEAEVLAEGRMERWSHHLSLERGNPVKIFRGVL